MPSPLSETDLPTLDRLPTEEVRREKLSVLLRRLAQEFADRPLDFDEVIRVTQGRAYDVLLVFLTLPFLTPIPLPFLSTALGSIIVLIGTRLMFGQRPWLPRRILAKKVHGAHLIRLLNAGSAVLRRLEYVLRPRLAFVHSTWVFQRITGLLIAVSGFLLLLPLPIPFSNSLPATTVLLLAAGALERDGAFFFAGCTAFTIALGFFVALAIGGMEAVNAISRWFGIG